MLWVVVGRKWRPRGKRAGGARGGRPCVTRHGRHRTSPALHVTRKTRSRRLAVAPLHHGAPRWLHLPRAGSGGGSKLRPTCWRSFVRSPHVVGRRRCRVVASAPGVQAEEGRALHVTGDPAR